MLRTSNRCCVEQVVRWQTIQQATWSPLPTPFAQSGSPYQTERAEPPPAPVLWRDLADSIDLTTAAGQALAGMLSVFAQFERQLIIERVRSGMNHAKKHGTRSGKAIGRPATIAGRANEIRALASEGLSMAAIARKLDLGYGSVHRVMAGYAKAPA
jgi:hypothetical protein